MYYIYIYYLDTLPPYAASPSYKTRLCKHYQAGQKCQHGNKCQYAHGESELRKPSQTFQEYQPIIQPMYYPIPFVPPPMPVLPNNGSISDSYLHQEHE